jgi:hypothetical protein
MPFHPSPRLNFYFGRRPYQGADPSNAQHIFIGEDANFAPDIEEQAIWPCVEEYLTDGVAFWNRHGVHHPFLLEGYDGQGAVYHGHYSAIFNHGGGVANGVAALLPANIRQSISFVEYLDRPTTGNGNINNAAMVNEVRDRWHFGWLAQLLIRRHGDPARTVYLSKGVATKLRHDTEDLFTGLLPANPPEVVQVFPANARRHQVVIGNHVCDYNNAAKRLVLHGTIRTTLLS